MNMLDKLAIQGYLKLSTFLTAEQNFITTGENLISMIQAVVGGIFAICLVVFIGLPLIAGGDEGRQKAKKAAPGMVIGLIICVGAITIAEAIKGKIVFTK